jgi:tetratricopeptide (TPR) repeat protein
MVKSALPDKASNGQFERAAVRRMLHVTERQLQSWERRGLVGAAEAYTFRDLIGLRAIKELRSRKIPLREIVQALESLKRRLSEIQDPLSELKVFSDGGRIAVRVAGQNMEARTGQILFDFDTSELAGVQALAPQPLPNRDQESEGWFQRGLFLEETGAPVEQAIEAYQQAIECNPHAAGALVNLGTIYYRLRRFAEAERYYAQSLEADPDYPLALFNLGNLYDERGELDKARRCYEKALRLNPKYGDAHFNLALLCERTGDVLKAVSHWKTYLKLDNASSWSEVARRQLEKLRVALLS